MGIFFREWTCPQCNRTIKWPKWSTPKCPYCTPIVVPNYDIIGPLGDSFTETQLGLIEAGKAYQGAHVCESEVHPALMKMATRHSKYQADHKTQGHQLFESRIAELRKIVPCSSWAEIAAESWKSQKLETKRALGDEMFKCWRASPGHWSVACKKHKYFGGDMAMGTNGTWYATIIVGD
jgi:hypothetical protein